MTQSHPDIAGLVAEIREHIGHQWSDRTFVQSEKVRDIMLRAAQALESLSQQRTEAGVPEGWKLVPVAATEEMIEAYAHAGKSVFFSSIDAKNQWKAMLSASPPAPKAEVETRPVLPNTQEG